MQDELKTAIQYSKLTLMFTVMLAFMTLLQFYYFKSAETVCVAPEATTQDTPNFESSLPDAKSELQPNNGYKIKTFIIEFGLKSLTNLSVNEKLIVLEEFTLSTRKVREYLHRSELERRDQQKSKLQ